MNSMQALTNVAGSKPGHSYKYRGDWGEGEHKIIKYQIQNHPTGTKQGIIRSAWSGDVCITCHLWLKNLAGWCAMPIFKNRAWDSFQVETLHRCTGMGCGAKTGSVV